MFTFIAIVHIVVSIVMIFFILLQDPKGGSPLGMLGSGGSKSLFGNAGANQFLVSVTKWSAAIFVCTSVYLAVLSHQGGDSVMDDYTQSEEDDLNPVKEDGTSPQDDNTRKTDASPTNTPEETSDLPQNDDTENEHTSDLPQNDNTENEHTSDLPQNDNTENENTNEETNDPPQNSHALEENDNTHIPAEAADNPPPKDPPPQDKTDDVASSPDSSPS